MDGNATVEQYGYYIPALVFHGFVEGSISAVVPGHGICPDTGKPFHRSGEAIHYRFHKGSVPSYVTDFQIGPAINKHGFQIAVAQPYRLVERGLSRKVLSIYIVLHINQQID
jgi:hypothetical protein